MTRSPLRSFPRGEVLNPRDFALIPALMLVFSLIAQPGISSWRLLAIWTLVNVLAIGVVWLGFTAWRFLLRRLPESRDVSATILIVVGASLGAIKATSTAGFGVLAGVDPEFGPSLVARLPQTLVVGALAVWGISVGINVRRALEVHARTRVSRELSRRLSQLTSIDDIDLPAIKRALSRTRASLANAATHPLSATHLVDSVVRPLSHELWHEAARTAPRFSITWMDMRVVSGRLYCTLPVAMVWAATSMPVHLARATPLEAILWTLAAGGVLAVVLEIFRRAPIGHGRRVVGYLFVTIAAWALGIWQVSLWWWGPEHPLASPWIYLSALLWVSVLIVLSGVLALVSEGGLALGVLSADISESTEGAFETDVSRRLARFLHGEVVNKLLRLSHNIEAESHESAVMADSEKNELLARLESGAWLHPPTSSGEIPEHFLESIARHWRGIIDVRWDMSEGVVVESLELATAAEIIDEALVNAYRHGLATHAELSISQDSQGAIVVEVRDDGVGPRNGAAGLGTTIFERASGGEWRLSPREEGGSICRVVIDRTSMPSEGIHDGDHTPLGP